MERLRLRVAGSEKNIDRGELPPYVDGMKVTKLCDGEQKYQVIREQHLTITADLRAVIRLSCAC